METNPMTQSAPLIVDVGSAAEAISTDDSDARRDEVESLCMRCREIGRTRLLLTLIPNFRKILLSAFECPHCGERNNHVQFGGEIQPKGCYYSLNVPSGDKKMFNRQVVKSETAKIMIPELDFEIPPEAQRGFLSTVEGILIRAADEFEGLQEDRKNLYPRTAEAIDGFLIKLKACASAQSHFTFILEDPSGNSFIENPYAPCSDPLLSIKFYERTREQHRLLRHIAFLSQQEPAKETKLVGGGMSNVQEELHGSVGEIAARRAIAQGNSAEIADSLFHYSAPQEMMTFSTNCGGCGMKCECRMFVTYIPYFQEVIVMASTCDSCDYRNSEVKGSGAIPGRGRKIVLHVNNFNDLSRDVIKSDTASVEIPELELELSSRALGGFVTNVEGLVSKISESFAFTDGMDDAKTRKWEEFREKIDQLKWMEKPWTLILDDALSNSFIAPITDDIKEDTMLSLEEYDRTWDQNEELGLNDLDASAADVSFHSVDVEENRDN